MSEKPVIKRPGDPDQVDGKEPKLDVEVVEDLDLPQDDAEAVRGGLFFTSTACGKHIPNPRLTV